MHTARTALANRDQEPTTPLESHASDGDRHSDHAGSAGARHSGAAFYAILTADQQSKYDTLGPRVPGVVRAVHRGPWSARLWLTNSPQ